jgi:hypothetical protein
VASASKVTNTAIDLGRAFPLPVHRLGFAEKVTDGRWFHGDAIWGSYSAAQPEGPLRPPLPSRRVSVNTRVYGS